jgi:hypothetical protein
MDGWVQWHGGECPIPNAKAGEYELEFRDGRVLNPKRGLAMDYVWGHVSSESIIKGGDIIAYRLIEQEQSDLDGLEDEIEKIPVMAVVNSMKGVGPDFATTTWISKQDVLDLIKQRKGEK